MSQREEIQPLLYTPWQQEGEVIGAMHFALRTGGEPTAFAATVRQAVHELDSNLPVTQLSTQTERAQATVGKERLSARLLIFFGGLALLLAAIGLSGVLAYSVARRSHEIGIRMALGAQTANVLRLVIWQGMKLVLLGLAVGALGGYALTRALSRQYFETSIWRQMSDRLYGVKGTDPQTLFVIATVLPRWWPWLLAGCPHARRPKWTRWRPCGRSRSVRRPPASLETKHAGGVRTAQALKRSVLEFS